MLTNKDITLYHYNGDNWGIAYCGKANVYHKQSGERNKGLTENLPAIIRIPTAENIKADINDRLVIGISLSPIPPKEGVLYVKSVCDNRRGSIDMQHWRLDCE